MENILLKIISFYSVWLAFLKMQKKKKKKGMFQQNEKNLRSYQKEEKNLRISQLPPNTAKSNPPPYLHKPTYHHPNTPLTD